jgi:pyruvate dehydrogenase E2 component (dihydrolipoamide acetyltransferase)
MIEFRLPSLGADMDEGKLLEWRVQPGEAVKKGQVVCVVDTAKAAIDVECWHDGTVQELLIEPGTTIPVGTPMAILREAGEPAEEVERRIAAARPAAKPAAAPAAAPAAGLALVAALPPIAVVPPAAAVLATGAPPVAAARPAAAPGTRRRISPAARKRALELGIDIDDVPEGADGTVALADVEQAAHRRAPLPAARAPSAAPPTAATMAERAAQMRKVIGAAMARSKREIPHYYLAEDVPLAAATGWLAEQNASRGVADRLLLAPLLLKGVAAALRRYPEFNGYYRDDAFAPSESIHIGVAISLRAGGLVTPALLEVDRKGVEQLNRELLDLIRRTRAGSLKSTELSAGTITVTSLGEQGVAAVYGVIYPPQVALVGFGRVTERPWAVDGGLRVAPVVTATLAADHRVSDGHRGGLFLAALRELLQNPAELTKSPT